MIAAIGPCAAQAALIAALVVQLSRRRLRSRASISGALAHLHLCRSGTVAESVAHLFERANDIATDVHGLSHDLHPTKLEIVGLTPAVEDLCRDVSHQYNVWIEFRQGV